MARSNSFAHNECGWIIRKPGSRGFPPGLTEKKLVRLVHAFYDFMTMFHCGITFFFIEGLCCLDGNKKKTTGLTKGGKTIANTKNWQSEETINNHGRRRRRLIRKKPLVDRHDRFPIMTSAPGLWRLFSHRLEFLQAKKRWLDAYSADECDIVSGCWSLFESPRFFQGK